MIHYLITVYIISILISAYYLYSSKFPKQLSSTSLDNQPSVSIIIPARNEERNIKRLLDSLINLEYDNYEIILVDGNSTDNTVNITEDFETVQIVHEPDRPKGWVGKPWGCYTGYKEAKGDILLFTDADTWHHPQSLDKTVAELKTETKGFLSLLTTQEFQSFWEHMLTIVFLIISISVRGTKGTGKAQIANGQYMMFTRETYEKLGTHQVVANSIIEDLAFGTHAAKQGIPPHIPSYHNLVTARMYQSLGEIKEGFGKNLALGVGQTGFDSIIATGFISIWGLGWIVIALYDLLILANPFNLSSLTWMILLLGYLSFAIMLFFLESRLSTKGTIFVLFYPIYFIAFYLVVLISLIQTYLKKEIQWKDQTYQI